LFDKFQSLLAKSAENMLLAINKPKYIMLWHIYIYIRRKKRINTKKKIRKIQQQKTHTQAHKEKFSCFGVNKIRNYHYH